MGVTIRSPGGSFRIVKSHLFRWAVFFEPLKDLETLGGRVFVLARNPVGRLASEFLIAGKFLVADFPSPVHPASPLLSMQ